MGKHFDLLIQDKCEKVALLEIRSHALWYLKGIPGGAKVKNLICSSKSVVEIFSLLDEFKGEL